MSNLNKGFQFIYLGPPETWHYLEVWQGVLEVGRDVLRIAKTEIIEFENRGRMENQLRRKLAF